MDSEAELTTLISAYNHGKIIVNFANDHFAVNQRKKTPRGRLKIRSAVKVFVVFELSHEKIVSMIGIP